jgi:hypothetical protein
MDSVQQATDLLDAQPSWRMLTARQLAELFADAGLLADTRCRKCNGTGGTDLGGARCAVCNGTGHRRAES